MLTKMLWSVFPNSKYSEGIHVLLSCLFGLTSNASHSLLTKEMDHLRKNPLCFLQLEIHLSSTLHLFIFMLFHILPIPLPEIKLGLVLEALLVLWIPRLTMLHSDNAYIKVKQKSDAARQIYPCLARSRNIPSGKLMHNLFQILCLFICIIIRMRS